MQARRRLAFFLLLSLLLIGCRNTTDKVEAELRNREVMYREAVEEQRRAEAQIVALHREIEALRVGAKVTPEQAAQAFGLKRITLGRATGAFDHDSLPGDEILQVIIEPRDQSDHLIKAPGAVQILTLEVMPQGVKFPLCAWDIGPEQLRQSWKQGLLSTGYTLSLPWKKHPSTEQVRVIVRLLTPDQRVFEADKDIKVRVMPGALPPPRQVEPIPEGPFLIPTSRTTNSSPSRTEWRALP